MLVGKDVAFVVADHDFTKVKLVPSVDLAAPLPVPCP